MARGRGGSLGARRWCRWRLKLNAGEIEDITPPRSPPEWRVVLAPQALIPTPYKQVLRAAHWQRVRKLQNRRRLCNGGLQTRAHAVALPHSGVLRGLFITYTMSFIAGNFPVNEQRVVYVDDALKNCRMSGWGSFV